MLGRVIGLLAGLALLAEAYLLWRPQTLGVLSIPDLGPFTQYRMELALLAAGVGFVVGVAAILRPGKTVKARPEILVAPAMELPHDVVPVAAPTIQLDPPVAAASSVHDHAPEAEAASDDHALDPFPATEEPADEDGHDHAPTEASAEAPRVESSPEPAPAALSSGDRGAFLTAMDAGDHLRAAGQLDEALEPYSNAVSLVRARIRTSAQDPAARRDLACALTGVGDVYDREGRLDAALDAHQESLDLRRALAADAPGDLAAQRSLSLGLGRLAETREVRGHRSRARDLLRERLPLAERLAAMDPGDATLGHDVALTRERLAELDAALAP